LRLPDYKNCVELNQLMTAMGVTHIPSLPPVRFEREVVRVFDREEVSQEDIQITENLAKAAIAVSRSQLYGQPGELLEFQGRKICAYIRDQKTSVNFRGNWSDYRYHLCNCRTLQSMRDFGRERRYLATQRTDGFFIVHDLTVTPPQSGIVRMELCQNCKDILVQKRIYFQPFSLSGYFERYNTYVPRTIRRIEEVRTIQTYTPDHAAIAREYKKAAGHKCQVCHVDCSSNKELLHLHHRDGDASNNNHANLAVLCVECHTKQPKHNHMKRNPQFINSINMVLKLRRDQGLLTVN